MQNAVRGRAVLMLPTWYPGPSDPVAGVFVRDQALAIAAHHDVTVLVLEAADPPPGRRTDVAIADEDGLPAGIQLLAPAMQDQRLYAVGAALEARLLQVQGGSVIDRLPEVPESLPAGARHTPTRTEEVTA